MSARVFLAIAGASGAVSAAIDAAADHLLTGDPHRAALAATAARYGLIHAAALLALSVLIARSHSVWLLASGWFFIAGLALFCGGLDLVAAGAPPRLAMLVPWGGAAFILGWIALLIAALRPRPAA
ncbi:MAG TPA: DUF423 domain-containing protein [Stellaceae bacterium]|nr:DUF423 domain-containing protein [Stellaceae bacterium]